MATDPSRKLQFAERILPGADCGRLIQNDSVNVILIEFAWLGPYYTAKFIIEVSKFRTFITYSIGYECSKL